MSRPKPNLLRDLNFYATDATETRGIETGIH